MKLTFSVLWFDDREDYFDSLDLEPLESEVREWGFEPKIDKVTTPEEFNKHKPFKLYDLIIVDRNLEGHKDGQDFIADLRGHSIYTEVIFYTAGKASELWEAIYERQLEGVFISSKNDIISKIIKVGRQSIRKVLDLENMRGIVMAEVGELDHLLDKIITSGVSSLVPDQQTSIFKRFYENSSKQNINNQQRLDEFNVAPDATKMLLLCDSDKRWQNFNRLWKCHTKLRSKPSIGDYQADVLIPRNALAHGRPEPHTNGGHLFRHHGREYHFNETTSLELRNTIIKYRTEFSNILQLLTDNSTTTE